MFNPPVQKICALTFRKIFRTIQQHQIFTGKSFVSDGVRVRRYEIKSVSAKCHLRLVTQQPIRKICRRRIFCFVLRRYSDSGQKVGRAVCGINYLQRIALRNVSERFTFDGNRNIPPAGPDSTNTGRTGQFSGEVRAKSNKSSRRRIALSFGTLNLMTHRRQENR